MGNICPCLRPTEHVYREVPQPKHALKRSFHGSVANVAMPPEQHTETSHISIRSSSTEVGDLNVAVVLTMNAPCQDADMDSPVTSNEILYNEEATPFKGCEVLQKFNNSYSYTKR